MRGSLGHVAQGLLVALLLICTFAVPLACRQQPAPTAPVTETLTILTPHSEEIRDTFETGFWNWYTAKGDRNVRIEWGLSRHAAVC